MDPPPPYTVAVGYDGSHTQANKELEIIIRDSQRNGEGVSAHVVYRVCTTASKHGYPASSDVQRRFSHFSWLAQKLAASFKGCIIPALPEKSAVQKFQMSAEFISHRQRALQVFLNKVATHPVLRDSSELRQFLTANDQEWMLEMARWQAESSAAKPPAVSGALQWLKSLQHSAQNMVSGRSDDALEDAEYVKVRDYVTALEGHLAEAHKQAARLVRKEGELGAALAEFGLAAEQLGKFDDGPVRAAFDVLCSRAGVIANASRARAEALATSFEAPLKEAGRTVRSVNAAMGDRAAALSALCQARGDLDARKVKLAKLRATPGVKGEACDDAEREVRECEGRVAAARVTYDTIVARMTEELHRFQKERAADLAALLRGFALAQAQASAEAAKAWAEMLSEMTAQAGSAGHVTV